MTQAAARDVDEYIARAPASAQPALRELRKAIRGAVPAAEERLSYGMPYYHHHGRLAYFSLHTTHIGVYPFDAADLDPELRQYAAAKATLQFPLGAPLPLAAIQRALQRRAKQFEFDCADALRHGAAPLNRSLHMPTVRSADGTRIAYDVVGDGPPVILVDGALGFRAFGSAPALAALLAPTCRVYAYDRRGRGESGDSGQTPDVLEREIEDIDALIQVASGAASLYGISSGGALVLEAAARTRCACRARRRLRGPLRLQRGGHHQVACVPRAARGPGAEGRWRRRHRTVHELVGASDDGVQRMRQSPWWPTFEVVGPTLVNDAAALGDDRTPPAERFRAIAVPALVMDGSASLEHMPFMRASAEALTRAMPNARHAVLDGQSHEVDNQVLAPLLVEFFAARTAPVQA